MTRRNTRRGTKAKPPLLGIGNLDGGTAYVAANSPSGMPGHPNGFYCGVLCSFDSYNSGDYIFSSAPDASTGWLLVNAEGATSWRAAGGGGSGFAASPGASLQIDTVYALLGVHTSTHLRLYVNGVEVGAGSAITGYTGVDGIAYVAAGGSLNGYLNFFGAAYGLGVPTSQNILDWYCQVRTQRRIVDMPGAPASRLWRPTAGAADMTDMVGGSVTLNKFGTGHTALSLTSPNWG